ncbi:hypothetical protein PV325_003091 [Microctonus aethiopoides]|nr:hypothetical protein PV325_003091 [Microctonus aethiopoides]
MSNVFEIVFISFLFIIVTTNSLPIRNEKSFVPFWHLPCGEEIKFDDDIVINDQENIRESLESIKIQQQLTLTDYLNRDYEYLYERVRIGVHEHQYIPNWVPGKKEVLAVRRLAGKSLQTIFNHLPKFHVDMQKFAVAIEELLEDEPSPMIRAALGETKKYLSMMLCEIESNIVGLSGFNFLERVNRNIMSEIEREPVDQTRRLVRDWGVLLKYKDYLHAWRYVFDY